MTSVMGTGTPHIHTLRRAPRPGDIGHPGTCPLCSEAKAAPPCLACRDELRARLAEFQAAAYAQRAVN